MCALIEMGSFSTLIVPVNVPTQQRGRFDPCQSDQDGRRRKLKALSLKVSCCIVILLSTAEKARLFWKVVTLGKRSSFHITVGTRGPEN